MEDNAVLKYAEYVVAGDFSALLQMLEDMLEKEPNNIETLALMVDSANHAKATEEIVKYGERLIELLDKKNFTPDQKIVIKYAPIDRIILDVSTAEIWVNVENAYYGLGDERNARVLQNKMQERIGRLPPESLARAIKCETTINGIDSALKFAEQYRNVHNLSIMSKNDRDSKEYICLYKGVATSIFSAITYNYCAPNSSLLAEEPIETMQLLSAYLITLIDAFDNIGDSANEDPFLGMRGVAKTWLSQLSLRLYIGDGTQSSPEALDGQDYTAAKECFLCFNKLAQLGEVTAYHFLAQLYYHGSGVEKNESKALELAQKAVDLGDDSSSLLLALLYYYGAGSDSPNYQRAFEYIQKPAEQGNVNAISLLGTMYLNGEGTSKNEKLGVRYLKEAANLGDKSAQDTLLTYESYYKSIERGYGISGCLSAEHLNNYALCIAKMILTNKELKGVFEEEPNKCVAFLVAKYLPNDYFLQPLVDAHPSFAPAVNEFRRAIREDSVSIETFTHLFDIGFEMYIAEESYQFDVNFNIMLAVILCNLYSIENRMDAQALFFSVIEQQIDNIQGLLQITLLACALWGADYENFRALATDKYYELKSQNFGNRKDTPKNEEDTHQDQTRSTEQSALLKELNRQAEENRDSKGSSGGCYIATAVYGSYDCPEVWTLRRFRDNFLSSNWYGRTFIKIYYKVSPLLVRRFGKTKWFNSIWRGFLDRFVNKLQADGYTNSFYIDKEDRNEQ